MIQELPIWLEMLFGLIVIVAILGMYQASNSKVFLFIVIGWTILQSLLGVQGIFQDARSIPPRIMVFGLLPALILAIMPFSTTKGKRFLDRINLKSLTYFHSIRIPVEIVLALLFHQGLMSVYMTFEGTNFDIFSGITAPLVAFLAFRKTPIKRKLLLWWNVLCLLLLLNVVITAVFAIPSPFQKLSLDQPNMAVLYFPFNLLPTVVVPLVLFAHLVAFRHLSHKHK